MNESGVAVQKVLQRYNVSDLKKLIVVSDDLNTQPGTLMIQGEFEYVGNGDGKL